MLLWAVRRVSCKTAINSSERAFPAVSGFYVRPADAGSGSNLPARRAIFIKNNSAEKLFIGGPDVTTLNGYPLAQNEELVLDITDGIQLYGIVANTTADARTLELA